MPQRPLRIHGPKRVRNIRATKQKKDDLQTLVKRIVNKGREIKQWQYSILDEAGTDYGNTSVFPNRNVFRLTPDSSNTLVQGTGNSDRLGNKIRVHKAFLKVILYPHEFDNAGADQNINPRAQDIRMIIAHAKNNSTDLVVSDTFFELNNSTTSPQDNLQDMLLNVNKDVYVVNYDKIHKVSNANIAGSGVALTYQTYANNDYKLNKIVKLDITNMLPKNITWDDDGTTPTSFMPSVVLLSVRADGQNTVSGQYPFKYYSEVTIQYTDA